MSIFDDDQREEEHQQQRWSTISEDPPSWAPIDLTAHVNGTFVALQPTIMERTDGEHLLYAGMVNDFHGESESGKSMVAQAETARQLKAGNRALYIDFESDSTTVTGRLLMMGVSPEAILENLDYIRPETDPRSLPDERTAWENLLNSRYSLAVIDGVTEAFSVYGVKSIDNDEVTSWGRMVPRKIASATGAAVVVVDHVTKSSEGRGRFAIGAQAKMSYLTGASYSVEIISPIGVGIAGSIALRIGKDRPGQVRPKSGEWRKGDRTQETAVIHVDSTDPSVIRYTVEPPRATAPSDGPPLDLMEKISRCVEDAPSPPSFRKISEMVSGKDGSLREAITELVEGGYINITPGPRNSHIHNSIKRFRADSDRPVTVSVSRSKETNGDTHTHRSPDTVGTQSDTQTHSKCVKHPITPRPEICQNCNTEGIAA